MSTEYNGPQMTYLTLDQCRKLKELGYPQKNITAFWWTYCPSYRPDLANPDKREWTWGITLDKRNNFEQSVACPVFEELIEWLGDRFVALRFDQKEYCVQGVDFTVTDAKRYRHGYLPLVSGSSPLEAVYNLCVLTKED